MEEGRDNDREERALLTVTAALISHQEGVEASTEMQALLAWSCLHTQLQVVRAQAAEALEEFK